ncbi:DNA starvation/stationary phase protection protein [uncultured Paenibacillus sp.]|uniref:Dps family protein n=1 Tax=uncultured Paenibacillus sp. TaxID=227322 RepID=UPI0028D08255|nr:DNA starvation/stationary phase protection protein [uncultured Paenibacillus sp.]
MVTKKESTATRPDIKKGLSKLVAGGNVLYVKLHNFHWNVKGPNFFTLHVKFQEFYEEVTLMLDEIAERMLAIGQQPPATMKEYLELSSIKEAKGGEDPSMMIEALADDFQSCVDEMKEMAEAAEEEGDLSTHDLLVGWTEKLQKHIWMLEAYLGK